MSRLPQACPAPARPLCEVRPTQSPRSFTGRHGAVLNRSCVHAMHKNGTAHNATRSQRVRRSIAFVVSLHCEFRSVLLQSQLRLQGISYFFFARDLRALDCPNSFCASASSCSSFIVRSKLTLKAVNPSTDASTRIGSNRPSVS
jgi:hypothetical protein